MLAKIILGTANFTQQYGILSSGVPCEEKVKKILELSYENGISTLDTAFGYGDIFSVYSNKTLKEFIINTKFSVKDDLKDVYKKLQSLSRYKIDVLMVHDPQHIEDVDHKKLQSFFIRLKEENLIRRVGVSVYEECEVHQFASSVCKVDAIQLPLNPLNQVFNNKNFKQYVCENNIEIHARSLFLQGVLLSEDIPRLLMPLKGIIEELRKELHSYPSMLSGLLAWAKQQKWVHKWVLGVSNISDLKKLCKTTSEKQDGPNINFCVPAHPLLDPRTW